MNHDWDNIGTKVFEILKGNGYHLQLFDKYGVTTLKPSKATRFFATIKNKDSKKSKISSYSILVSLDDKGSNSSINIKTPSSEIIGEQNYSNIERLVLYLRRAVGSREDLLVHWAAFNRIIKLKDDIINNVKQDPNDLTETMTLEEQELHTFLNQYTVKNVFKLKESLIDASEVRDAISTYDGNITKALTYLISVNPAWRIAYEDDPKNALDTIKRMYNASMLD